MKYLLLLMSTGAYGWDCRDVIETARAAEEMQNIDLAIQALAMNDRTPLCLTSINPQAIGRLNTIIDSVISGSSWDYIVTQESTPKEMCRNAGIQKSYLTLSSQWIVAETDVDFSLLYTNDRMCRIIRHNNPQKNKTWTEVIFR